MTALPPHLTIVDQYGRPIPVSALYAGEFEGAAAGRRMGGWGLSSSGPNTALLNSLSSLRARQRELVRNHPLAGGGVDVIVANMIGTGIKPRWQIEDSELNERIQELWADSVPEMDAAGLCSFYGLQDVVARTMCNGGEALAQFHYVSPYEGLAVPLQVAVMEGDHLDIAYSTLADSGNEIRMGIEFDRTSGRRAAYHLWKNHPGEVPEHRHHFAPARSGIRGDAHLSAAARRADPGAALVFEDHRKAARDRPVRGRGACAAQDHGHVRRLYHGADARAASARHAGPHRA